MGHEILLVVVDKSLFLHVGFIVELKRLTSVDERHHGSADRRDRETRKRVLEMTGRSTPRPREW